MIRHSNLPTLSFTPKRQSSSLCFLFFLFLGLADSIFRSCIDLFKVSQHQFGFVNIFFEMVTNCHKKGQCLPTSLGYQQIRPPIDDFRNPKNQNFQYHLAVALGTEFCAETVP